MTEKTLSRYLSNLEKYFASDSPILQKTAKVFHELDQLEYDLGLIGADDTTATKCSWWPIVTLIGGASNAKSKFMNAYFGSDLQLTGLQTSHNKFSVLLHNNQTSPTTLPGTALDVDHRFPFYQISRKLEQLRRGEGGRINAYLELKTLPSDHLKGKLFIEAPSISATPATAVTSFLVSYAIENSDTVFVFTDTFETPSPLLDDLIEQIKRHQDTNKVIYLIDAPAALNSARSGEIISSWQRRLADLGIASGQFMILPSQDSGFIPQPGKVDFSLIDQRLANVGYDRTYRILQALESHIAEIENVIVPEVKKGIATWKERVNMSSLLVLSLFIVLALFAEINTGIVLATLIDPILGPIALLVLIVIMTPIHLIFSRLHAKMVINQLSNRQKELNLLENPAGMFEKNLTFSRMLLPVSEPALWNKKTKARLAQLTSRTKDLVQSLNDTFSAYNAQLFDVFADSKGPKQIP
ncbi:hypothetical protein [Methylomicrobium agile]|uniref:hypothetical protein n=1 Tax=Methylomicrobium agile TaxID=39774 RepID=UPI0004DF4DA2|nr:hypothetical protein [Methylomicrobium agile]